MEMDYWRRVTAPKNEECEKRKNKVVVSTLCICDHNGKLTPVYIKWKDNSIYKIDKIVDMKPIGSPKVGGREVKYSIIINKHKTNLYYDHKCWYVIEKRPTIYS